MINVVSEGLRICGRGLRVNMVSLATVTGGFGATHLLALGKNVVVARLTAGGSFLER